ncbi:nuclear transport factor 2 family protein [Paenibacillus sp. P26]|nr:nuclear transport factor 2 family protein [Paenibacillus sp. P26]UUZ91450.1 nuclear transport factor 2 family protein [Paenibacillus sp. P25]
MSEQAQGIASPREVVERFIAMSVSRPLHELADLYAPDSVIEMPFAPPGVPRSFEGREHHRARFRLGGEWMRLHKAESVVIHETADPEVIIVEYDLHGEVLATGRPFIHSYIMVIRIQDGLIVSSRDYSNPLASAETFGNLGEVLDQRGLN